LTYWGHRRSDIEPRRGRAFPQDAERPVVVDGLESNLDDLLLRRFPQRGTKRLADAARRHDVVLDNLRSF
jgi:hypothetical protein